MGSERGGKLKRTDKSIPIEDLDRIDWATIEKQLLDLSNLVERDRKYPITHGTMLDVRIRVFTSLVRLAHDLLDERSELWSSASESVRCPVVGGLAKKDARFVSVTKAITFAKRTSETLPRKG